MGHDVCWKRELIMLYKGHKPKTVCVLMDSIPKIKFFDISLKAFL